MLPLSEIPVNYIETVDDCFEFKRWLGLSRYTLGFDTETTGLRYWLPNFRIRLAQFGDSDSAWVFRVDRFGVLLDDVMREYRARISGHNLVSFDFAAMQSQGFTLPDPRLVHDTLIKSKLAQADQYDHSLKGNGVRHFGAAAAWGQDLLHDAFAAHGLREDSKNVEEAERAWTEIPYDCEAYSIYSGVDTVLAARLDEKLSPIIDAEFAEPYAREMASWFVTTEHERRGIRVDLKYANELHDEMSQEINIVRTQLSELGVPNPGQRQKLATKLIDEGWIPQEWSKKSGAPKLDKAVLEGIDNEVVGPLMEWSRLCKWRTAYVEAVLNRAHAGRVFPSINNLGARTGRMSAYGPPIHQMPAKHPDAWKIRRMFLPEEENVTVSCDYVAQENKLLYHFSADPALREIFDKKLDIHTYTAAAIFGVEYACVTSDQRGTAKTFNYASAYGAGDKKLAKGLGVTPEQVAVIRERVNGAFSGVAAYKQKMEDDGRAQYTHEGGAYARTLGGRRVYAEQGKYGEPSYFTLINYQLQGTGADILKETQSRIAAAGLSKHIILELHDELLLTVPPGRDGEEITHEIAKLMEYSTDDTTFGVPFRIAMTTSYGEQTPYWGSH